MPSPPRARTGALSLLAAAAALPFALPVAASASPSGVVISELRVGGPAGGNDEFVELLNASGAPVAVGGWRLQGCASGSGAASDRTSIPAGTTLTAGGRYLLANTATNGYSGAPRPDATYGTGFSNSGQSGVRLVEADGTVQDAIGFAGSPCAEGAGFDLARIAGTGGDSAHRGGADESADTDDNAADLTVAAPNPQRSDGDPGREPRDPEVTPINRIQGAGATSPMQGATVAIEGVVTGVDDLMGSNYTSVFPEDAGIWVQAEDRDADADPSTSEGVFVGYVRGPGNDRAALLGRRVRLTGSVREKFGQTQVNIAQNTQPEVLGDGAMPAPIAIDTAAAEAQTVDEAAGTRSYYESLEGMRVTLPVGIANSGGTTKFGELFLNPGTTRQRVFNTTTGPQVASLLALVDDAGAGDPGRDRIDLRPPSATHVAASLFARVQDAAGPLGFSFSNYKLVTQLDGMPTVTPDPLVPAVYTLDPAEPDELRVSGFNVENLFPPGAILDLHTVSQEEYDEKLGALAAAIRDRLRAPDVVAVQEIGDSLHAIGVPAPVRPKSSREVLQDLADRIGGGYEAHAVEAFDERGIDVGYLVKDGVTVHGDAQQVALDVPRPAPSCSSRPDQAFDRIPLALDVEKDGLRTTIVNNHFKSKSDGSEICREVEAEAVREVAERLAGDGREVIVTGDLNAFEFETPLRVLAEGGLLTNLWDRAPEQERYSYHYNGRLQTLDHALVTDGLLDRLRDFRYAHLDNDHPYDALLGQGVSDHDPPVLTLRTDFRAPADPAAFSTDVASVEAGSQVLGTSGAVQRVVVRNASGDGTPGGSALGIDAVTVHGSHPSDFAVTHSSCKADAPVAPGDTCVVSLRFNPSELGARTATLTFATSVGTRELPLGGTGVAAPAGRDGRDGAPGPAGPRGPRGERGPRGPRGARGEAGRGVQITIVVVGGRSFDRGSLGDLSLGLRNASAATARNARVRVTLPRGLAAASSRRGARTARRSTTLRVPAIRARATRRVALRVRTSSTARRGVHRARVSVRIGGRTVTRTITLRVR